MTELGETRGTVLLADDDPTVRAPMARALSRAGYSVVVADDGEEALRALWTSTVDVIVSDIDMPQMDGMQLLRAVRDQQGELPFILITGNAVSTEMAVEALERGVSQYLQKPFGPEELERAVSQALERHSFEQVSVADPMLALKADFDRTLSTLHMHYQPLVRFSDRSVLGYESLMRSAEPALPHPGAVLDAAERLERLPELGRHIRRICPGPMDQAPAGTLLFVNLHVEDLFDPELYDPLTPLSAIAERVVLEVTERARLEGVSDVAERVAKLRALGFRIAIDDIGAGYAGLTSFAVLEPDVLKIDMSLVRDVHESPVKQRLVGALVQVCGDLGSVLVAEGVETAEELATLIALGCDVFQGYLFARPGAAFPEPDFGAPS